MGAAAAIGGGMLLGSLAGKKSTSAQPVSNNQSTQQSTQVQQSSSEPWIGAQPGLATLYNAAVQNYYGGGPQYYPGQTVADQSWTTQHGLNMGQQAGLLGTQNMTGANALDQAGWLADRTLTGGMLYSDPAMAGAVAGSHFDANTMRGMSGLSNFGAGGNVGRTAGMPELGAIGRGAMLGGNPYVDRMFEQAAGRAGEQFNKYTMPGVASMFAGAGRYGSEAMNQAMDTQQQNFGDQINRLATDIYGGNYANERGLLQQALNTQAGIGSNERAQQLQALGLQTGNQLQGQGLVLNALGQLSNQYQNERGLQNQAMGMAPGLAAADYNDINQLLGIGGLRDARSQALIDDSVARWDFAQNANNNRLSFLHSIMQGAPMQSSSIGSSSSYGQSSGQASQPGNPMAPLQGALMGGMLGSGIAGVMAPAASPYMYSAPRVGMF